MDRSETAIWLRDDGLVHFVERPDYGDQTLVAFGEALLGIAEELLDSRIFLLVDLSQVKKMPHPKQTKFLRELLQDPRMVHFAMFGARGLLRVAATFVGTAAGKRGTLWESEAEAVAHLTALREAQAVAQITAPREAGRV